MKSEFVTTSICHLHVECLLIGLMLTAAFNVADVGGIFELKRSMTSQHGTTCYRRFKFLALAILDFLSVFLNNRSHSSPVANMTHLVFLYKVFFNCF